VAAPGSCAREGGTTGPILGIFTNTARAYKRGLGAEPPAAVQRAQPPVGSQGVKPPEVDEIFVLKK